MQLGIYVHFPFCAQKCYYCDFTSFENKLEMQDKYIEKLLKEIDENKEILKNRDIDTIYFGGGTPSILKPENIIKVLERIISITSNNSIEREITIEINPGTVTKEHLQIYKENGFNRISIGLQSAKDEILKEIGRIHDYKQFLNTYKWAREAGFKNINIDLMLGLPNQKILDLKQTLEEVIQLEPEHISIYSLIIEEGTKIKEMINSGDIYLPNDDEERKQYKYVKNFLELKGYEHYEISNFAKPGYESKHNTNCWEQKEYIGFGVAAHSYIDSCRYSNSSDLNEYIEFSNSKDIKIIHENQNKEEMKKEYMILGLRKVKGIKISEFKLKFRENPIYVFRKEIDKLVKEGLLVVDLDNIRLTEKGLDLANQVWEEFI